MSISAYPLVVILTAVLAALTGCDTPTTIGLQGPVMMTSVTSFYSSDECPEGGNRIKIGEDRNANYSLDPEEVLATSVLCSLPKNQIDPRAITFVKVFGVEGICEKHGVRIVSGQDIDRSGLLEDDEIQVSRELCHSGPYNPGMAVRRVL